MTPVVVVIGLTYDDARRYAQLNQAARPILKGARILSASAPLCARGLRIGKVIETPAAILGKHYEQVMADVKTATVRCPKPLT